LPDRSYFLLGQNGGIQTNTPKTLIAAGSHPQEWESFIGNGVLEYKTGLNHRMVAIFVGITVLFLCSRFDIYIRDVRQKSGPRLRKADVIK